MALPSKGPLCYCSVDVVEHYGGQGKPPQALLLGVGGSWGQPAETQSAAVQSKVLLFLLLADQTAVTQKMCAGAEGETQSLALNKC